MLFNREQFSLGLFVSASSSALIFLSVLHFTPDEICDDTVNLALSNAVSNFSLTGLITFAYAVTQSPRSFAIALFLPALYPLTVAFNCEEGVLPDAMPLFSH